MTAPRLVTRLKGDRATASSTAYWGALDGMRGFGVVAVMLFHLGRDNGGFLAVDMFFVISGFLITSLLLKERTRTGAVSFRAFYTRRALRLLPALLVMLVGAVAVTVVVPAQHTARQGTLHGLPFVLFYVGNWKVAFEGDGALGLLTHTWSLAVEEQFYLLWPAILLGLLVFCKTLRRVALAILAAAIVMAIYRRVGVSVLDWGVGRIYYATDTHCDGLLLGCFFAVILARRPGGVAARLDLNGHRAGLLAFDVLAGVSFAFMMFEWWHAKIVSPWSLTLTMPVFNLATAVVVANQVLHPAPVLTRVLNSGPATWLGKRSYGAYLWHPIIFKVIEATPAFHHGEALFIAVCFASSIAVAALSYRLVEAPFLRMKVRFATDGATAPPPSPLTPLRKGVA